MARFTRASFVEVMQEDFVRTARAKGLSEPWWYWPSTACATR
jgi:glutathione transport system permease protein